MARVDGLTAKSDDRFREIFERHYAAVRNYVRRRAVADVVDDVVAETFLVAWRRLDDVPVDPLPWLLSVARRVLATQRRTARRRASLAAKLQSVPPAVPPDDPDPGIAAALRRLPEKDREVITLIGWDGLTPVQAAGVIRESAVTVRVRLHRAKRRLRKELHRAGYPIDEAAGPVLKPTASTEQVGASR